MFLDGGVRRGTDVFKALALGAAGVFVSTDTLDLRLSFLAGDVDGRSMCGFGVADRETGAVLAGGGRRVRGAEDAADAAGRAGAGHGAQRVRVAAGHHARPRRHRRRQDPPRTPLDRGGALHPALCARAR